MCIAGLRAAVDMLGKKKKWLQTEKEMSNAFTQIYSNSTKSIPRTFRKEVKIRKIKTADLLPDTSLLGLVYPSGILESLDEKIQTTVSEIVIANTADGGGLFRYPADRYCGGVKKGWVTLTGAGTWPLLSFWMSIYCSLSGDSENARKFFNKPLKRIDKYIPEQIFQDKSRKSISPLLWSHAMFVIAAKYLGHI
jgi:GH15 family glucan-1,4-alpha-glucosidase